MKNLLKFMLAVVLVTAFSCGGDDDTPPIIPTVSFERDRNIVEPGDDITFTTTATDAESYLWDFGDGNTSDEENPVYAYSIHGSHTITLTVTSSTGDTAMSTSNITVGTRVATGITMVSIVEVDGSGRPWDSDGSGPDIFLGIVPTGSTDLPIFPIGNNITNSILPISGNFQMGDQIEFTNEDWDFVYVDDDEPFGAFTTDEIMGAITANPITAPSPDKDFATGTGTFSVSAGGFELIFDYEIRVP